MAVSDTVKIENVSINSARFSVTDKIGKAIDSTDYSVNFSKAHIIFKRPIDVDTVVVNYLKYPGFITKIYRKLDSSIIVEKHR